MFMQKMEDFLCESPILSVSCVGPKRVKWTNNDDILQNGSQDLQDNLREKYISCYPLILAYSEYILVFHLAALPLREN